MDGFKLYKELRKRHKNVKVCFLTAGRNAMRITENM